jgi:hypothetical protein
VIVLVVVVVLGLVKGQEIDVSVNKPPVLVRTTPWTPWLPCENDIKGEHGQRPQRPQRRKVGVGGPEIAGNAVASGRERRLLVSDQVFLICRISVPL